MRESVCVRGVVHELKNVLEIDPTMPMHAAIKEAAYQVGVHASPDTPLSALGRACLARI